MSMSTPGRRAAAPAAQTRRFTPVAALVLALPLLTAGVLGLVRTDSPTAKAEKPETIALSRIDLVCPKARRGTGPVVLAPGEQAGEVAVRVGSGEPRQVRLTKGEVAQVPATGPVVITGLEGVAAGMVATRVGTRAAAPCTAPLADQWFTGLGARPGHRTILELTNPDAGPAIANLTVYSRRGRLDVPRLRGIRVEGRTTRMLDLAALTPRRTDLAIHVEVQRGRVVPSAWDEGDPYGPGPTPTAWIPAQDAPATSLRLLGLSPGATSRRLTVANPGELEARVKLLVIEEASEFAPKGMNEIAVAPGTVRTVEIGDVVRGRNQAAPSGVLIESTQPITASLRSTRAGALSITSAAASFERAAVTLPAGRATLVLAGATKVGTARVREDGGKPTETRVSPRHSVSVPVAAGTKTLQIDLTGTPVQGAVIVRRGASVVVIELSQLTTQGLLPVVRPAL